MCEELDADTAAMKAIVGGAIVVSPVNCFEGLPFDDPGTTYVLGVVAPSQGANWTRSSNRWTGRRSSTARCERCASIDTVERRVVVSLDG